MSNTAGAAEMVLAARSLPTGKRDVLTLAHRPGSPVVHLYSGPLSPSGRYAAAGGRTVCHARTRRLTVLERDLGLLDHGRRVCHRCVARLTSLAGRATQPVSRDQFLAVYRGTTLRDLALMLAIATTVDETHRIGFLAQLLFGTPPVRRPVELSPRQAYYDLHAAVLRRRRDLHNATRTPEELQAAAQRREAEEFNAKVLEAGRRQTARIDRLSRYSREGRYLTGRERAEIGMTG
jgi:hypothetical protein